jgi:hypothetical protein
MPSCDQRDAETRRKVGWSSCLCVLAVAFVLHGAPRDPFTLDRAAERWVEQTLKKLTSDEKVGQLIVPSPIRTSEHRQRDVDMLTKRCVSITPSAVSRLFGAVSRRLPAGTRAMGRSFVSLFPPLSDQSPGAKPSCLLNTADFEIWRRGFAFSAPAFRGRWRWARSRRDGLRPVRQKRITALESRAGVSESAPVADVNSKRATWCNQHRLGREPGAGRGGRGRLAPGTTGMIATVKHFP